MPPRLLYQLSHVALSPGLRMMLRPKVRGVGSIPKKGPVIIASNHLSFFDSVIIPLVAPRQISFLAKDDYFTGTGVKGTLTKAFFTETGMIPVDRDDPRAGQIALDLALEVLGNDGAFGIYPEGTRSRDGRLYRGHTGIGQLVMRSGAPVVPCALKGTEKLQPVGTTVPRPAKCSISFGRPMDFRGKYEALPPGKARRLIVDDVMAAIHKMSGQELAGMYNDRSAQE